MVQWSASNDNATVDQTGKVTGRKAGSVTITAKDNGFTANHTMTVVDPTVHVTGVTVEPDSLSLTEGDSQQITVTVNPPNATDKAYTTSSSDPGKVAAEGTTITGVAPTTEPVTVTVRTNDGGHTDTVSVTVTARPPIGGDTTNIVGKAIVGKAVL